MSQPGLTEAEKRRWWNDPMLVTSGDWEQEFPDHCYFCHVASESEPPTCGPHCDPPALRGKEKP